MLRVRKVGLDAGGSWCAGAWQNMLSWRGVSESQCASSSSLGRAGPTAVGPLVARSLHARANSCYAGLAGAAHSSDSRIVRSLTGMIWRLVVRPPVAAAKAAWKASSCGRGWQQRERVRGLPTPRCVVC